MKPLFIIVASMLIITCSCSQEVVPKLNDYSPTTKAFFTDKDFRIEGLVISPRISREEALSRGISSSLYDSMLKTINNLNQKFSEYANENTLLTKSYGGTIQAYGILIADESNSYYATSSFIPLTGYPNFTLIVSFSVIPDSYMTGANNVYVNTNSYGQLFGPFYYQGHAFDTPVDYFVQLSYTYSPQTTGEQGICGWGVLGY